ncbi:hypothetical protein [Halomarina pelagica]|uniref:hypothetical protein n=1 Tax=Halomarina pelagica TaxID=2961599 RepID=UPI0020C49FE4|nr:hypothetical protein [Halomarina sp. BND7]
MSEEPRAPFVVACPDCEVRTATDDPNETVAFYRRHRAVTGHDLAWERAEFDGADDLRPDADGTDGPGGGEAVLAAIVDDLEGTYGNGVPVGIVAAAMGARGVPMGETLERIRALRMRGALYEPRDDHLASV